MPKARCPRCKHWIKWKGNPYRPFCSERCKLIDLGKWLDEEYLVKGEDLPDKSSLKEKVVPLPIKKK